MHLCDFLHSVPALLEVGYVIVLMHWTTWSNRGSVYEYYRNFKTCAERFLSTFDRNVLIKWPFKDANVLHTVLIIKII